MAWADCKMNWTKMEADVCKETTDYVDEWDCHNTTVTVYHNKTKPHCENVTYENCVSKWVINKLGKQVRKY